MTQNLQTLKLHRTSRRRTLELLAIASTLLVALPVNAAEQIHFRYGALDLELPIAALDTYAQVGHAEPELKGFVALMPAKTQSQVRHLLTTQLPIEAKPLKRLLKAPMGQMMLTEMGRIIQTSAGENGAGVLQEALAIAAEDAGGLTPISVLHHLKSDIQIDVKQVIQLHKHHQTMSQKANLVIQDLQQSSATASLQMSPTNPGSLPDLRSSGQLAGRKETITVAYTPQSISGQLQQRSVTADLYLPDRQAPTSIIVISHGLGESRNNYVRFARHLMSYGFAVVVMEHSGSNKDQTQALYEGQSHALVDVQTFVDRPADVTQILNELEKRNHSNFGGQLNLQQVGVFGYSLGGYTALALAGAEIDFGQLDHNCRTQSFLLNPSLLLQCRALELPHRTYQLRDPRIQAILVVNPVNASIFGKSSLQTIKIPVFWGTGSKDIVTPMAMEQIHSFQALTTPHKYLGIVQDANHGSSPMSLGSLPLLTGQEKPTVLDDYLNAMSLAFMQVHVEGDEMYRSYLQPSYAQAISRDPFRLSLMKFNGAAPILSKNHLTRFLDTGY